MIGIKVDFAGVLLYLGSPATDSRKESSDQGGDEEPCCGEVEPLGGKVNGDGETQTRGGDEEPCCGEVEPLGGEVNGDGETQTRGGDEEPCCGEVEPHYWSISCEIC